ncbi:anthrone oxygenase family protein [Microbacterium sp.]|uniref:anthrone oxygenase family protein n=1 Tax=Microbacterium sp. TaxID=51671 RepID=UPI002811222E|nr:anthrone oxygenase family protein [Microbacterium sp.]
MTDLLPFLLGVSALGAAVAGGVFFAFSGFVMHGLNRLSASEAARAMRAVNVTAERPPLMIELFGTALVGVAVAVMALVRGSDAVWWTCAAAALYLVAVIGVTATANVPRNNALAAAAEHPDALARAWNDYHPGWTRWNHVRAAGGMAAAALFIVALAFAV